MQLSHTRPVASAVFDDPNIVSSAGLVPMMKLARKAGLHELADEHLSVPGDKGANAGLKLSSVVAGMIAGADSIDDLALPPTVRRTRQGRRTSSAVSSTGHGAPARGNNGSAAGPLAPRRCSVCGIAWAAGPASWRNLTRASRTRAHSGTA